MTAGTGPYWSIITPAERTNLIRNPSVEFNLTGWGTTSIDAEISRAAGRGAFGAYGIAINGAGGRVVKVNDGLAGQAVGVVPDFRPYTLSAYVRANGSVALVAGNTPSGTFMHSMVAGSSDSWMRLTTTFYPMVSEVYPRVVAWGGAHTGTIFADGFQIEEGTAATTYFDGDQPGCRWLGQPHASPSFRSGTTRSGGAVQRFYDIGLLIDESPGIGAPPAQLAARSNVLLPGAEFLRQRATERAFALRGIVEGDSWSGLHRKRRRLIEALRIENTSQQQPATLLYSGAGGTLRIDAVWDGGLEFGEPEGFAERVDVRFNAAQPYWYNTIQQGTALSPFTALPQTNNVIYRDRNGFWGTGPIPASLMIDSPFEGTVYVVSEDAGFNDNLYYIAGSTYGLAGSGTITGDFSETVYSFDQKTLLIGGRFLTANGTYGGQMVTFSPYTGESGTAGWIAEDPVPFDEYAVVLKILPYKNGSYIIGGRFGTINGVGIGSAYNLITWNGQNGGWGSLGPAGSLNFSVAGFSDVAVVYDMVPYGENDLLITTDATRFSGGTATSIMRYRIGTAWGTVANAPVSPLNGVISNFFVTQDQRIYFGGNYTDVSGLGRIDNLAISPVGTIQSFDGLSVSRADISRIVPDKKTLFWVEGAFNWINGVTPTQIGLARSNGFNFFPADMSSQFDESVDVYPSRSGTTYYYSLSNMYERRGASVGTIVNAGLADAYPTLRLVAGNTGTVTVKQLENITTGDFIWFALNLMPNERAILTLEPGSVSFTSSIRGNLFDTIIRGSNLSTWRLMPGPNLVSFFADQSDVQADLYWTPRYISADGSALQ